MLTKDLIKQLQKLVDEHEPHVPIMGEHEVMIDCFALKGDHLFEYRGFDKTINLEYSDDGVYLILSRWAR